MKVLRGSLKETLYSWPGQVQSESEVSNPPAVMRETTFNENEVTYMSDELGVHKISNTDPERVAVSLHRKFYVRVPCLLSTLTKQSLHTAARREQRLSHLLREDGKAKSCHAVPVLRVRKACIGCADQPGNGVHDEHELMIQRHMAILGRGSILMAYRRSRVWAHPSPGHYQIGWSRMERHD